MNIQFIIPQKDLWASVGNLTFNESAIISQTPEAMRSFLAPSIQEPPTRPDTLYLKLYEADLFVGAMWMQIKLPEGTRTELSENHLLVLPRGKHLARILTELACVYCQLTNREPVTTVRKLPALQPIHNFLLKLGAETLDRPDQVVYYLPRAWTPKHISSVRIVYPS